MNWDEAWLALIIGAPSFALGYLAYRRSRKVDAISAQSGIVNDARAGTAQVIQALNVLVDQIQEDNKGFREDIKHCGSRLDALTFERDTLKRELARLRRKYGENGDTPPHGTPVTP